MELSLHSYPSLYAVDHAVARDLFSGPVIVEEKIDGSQFSFGVTQSGEFLCRSKGVSIPVPATNHMFALGVSSAQSFANRLTPGWTYRAEFLAKPKHNALEYARTPANHFIVFDISTEGVEGYLTREQKEAECARLGFEITPLFYQGKLDGPHELVRFMDTTSVLGLAKIEGVVVKPAAYDVFGRDKKVVMAKFVSEDFKEKHTIEWGISNPSSVDIVTTLGSMLRCEQRWTKAVERLRDSGRLESSPKDIGLLLNEVPEDILKECADEMKEMLLQWAWPKVKQSTTRGLAQWYKERLKQ
jgi:hypothetical protein